MQWNGQEPDRSMASARSKACATARHKRSDVGCTFQFTIVDQRQSASAAAAAVGWSPSGYSNIGSGPVYSASFECNEHTIRIETSAQSTIATNLPSSVFDANASPTESIGC